MIRGSIIRASGRLRGHRFREWRLQFFQFVGWSAPAHTRAMRTLLAFATIGLLCGSVTLAAENAAPAVEAVQLAAFMEKWKTYEAANQPTNETDFPLLLAALIKDPAGPWYAYLATQFAEGRYQLRCLAEPARQTAAVKSVPPLKQADQTLAAAIQQGGTNAADLAGAQFMVQKSLSAVLLAAGPAYLPEARALGQRMLAQLPATNTWNYGNVIYHAHQLLGRVALREGKLNAARDCLRRAGQAPATPQLINLGPDNWLAREVLQHGEPADREAVLGYLDDIAHLWARPRPTNANAHRVSADHLKQLDAWKTTIRAGNIPDDPKWH
jgi:hypothetical protein